ncbi:ATP-binding protein [Patulibacter minatonensis]|uniref:ATP-binding protein n=1 Tax=Patulibacter minatonensis TaxID=298163 RepID=UPI00047EBC32|nr:ATP-binding protein [Patulibacter minatonensis]
MPRGDHLDGLESRRFSGRVSELGRLADLLVPEPERPVVVLHGPGGIGKSALLREVARRATDAGMPVHRVDGRDRDRAQEALAAALETLGAGGTGPPSLLIVDTYEAVPALGAPLRRGLRPLLGSGARVLIAGRRPPEPAWREDGWSEVLRAARIEPLPPGDARELVRLRGLAPDATTDRVTAWAAGSPLALTVATDAILAGHTPDLDRLDADDLLADTLLQRLAADELDGADREVLAVASIALAVDARLLAAVLPGTDGDHAEAWLRSRSFSEPVGTRVTLHDRVRRAVRGSLEASDPEHARELRRRLADHLYARLNDGEARLFLDLAELITDPELRRAIAPPPLTHHAECARDGDADVVGPRLPESAPARWPALRRWFDEAPGAVVLVRDTADRIVGYGVAVTPATAPPWAVEDPVLGPWLADAKVRAPAGDVMLMRESGVLLPEPDAAEEAAVIATGNHAIVRATGPASARWAYVGMDPRDTGRLTMLDALGYERLTHLDVPDAAGGPLACFVRDFGPGGVSTWVRDVVYQGLGLPPASVPRSAGVDAATVRDALRTFHDVAALAASPLARGVGTAERAGTVRARIERAASAAFGDSAEERLQADVLRRGYLDPDGGHARAMLELHVSRTTYFRRLARAADRVVDHVLADVTG